MKLAPVFALSIVALAGCSDPKEASKGNFEHAINEWIEKDPPCLDIPDGTVRAPGQGYAALPMYVEATPEKQPDAEEMRQTHLAPLNAMVDAGLLKTSRTEIEATAFLGPTKKVAVIAYDLSETGKGIYKDGEKDGEDGSSPRGAAHGFCYGKPEVDEIVNFTQPGDMMGMTVSQVSYKYHLADLPDWATNAKMKAAFPALAEEPAKSKESKAAVVLTNEGWKHQGAI